MLKLIRSSTVHKRMVFSNIISAMSSDRTI